MIETAPTIHERELPHRLLENLWTWAVFSEEKQLYFNGYALLEGDGVVLIDPPAASEATFKALSLLGKPHSIVLTNADHERDSNAFREAFHIPVWCHVLDAPHLNVSPEHTFRNGFQLPGNLQAIHLLHQKSPGECTLYQLKNRWLFIGDALIHRPGQGLSMLPAEKYPDITAARTGLERLSSLEPDALLLGDGEPILEDAHTALNAFFNNNPAPAI